MPEMKISLTQAMPAVYWNGYEDGVRGLEHVVLQAIIEEQLYREDPRFLHFFSSIVSQYLDAINERRKNKGANAPRDR